MMHYMFELRLNEYEAKFELDLEQVKNVFEQVNKVYNFSIAIR